MLCRMEAHIPKAGRPKKARPPAQTVQDDERTRHLQLLGQRLREQRERLSWSIADLACRAGVTAKQIHTLEQGKHAPLTWTMVLLSRALGCSAGWLSFGG